MQKQSLRDNGVPKKKRKRRSLRSRRWKFSVGWPDKQVTRYFALKLAQKWAPESLTPHLAARLLMTPPRPNKTQDAVDFLKSGKRHKLPFQNERILAWSWGEGPLVVLVHGWGGYGAQLREFVPSLVIQGYQVITFDAFGHGESGGSISSVVHISQSLDTVLSHFTGPVKAIIAHSMGTSALLLHLAQRKTKIDYLALISAPFEGPIAHSRKFAEKVGMWTPVPR